MVCVSVPPRLQSPNDLEVVTLVGEEVTLPCEASGDPYPDIKWSKNQVPIDFYDHSHGYMMQESGSLYISQASTVDAGKYECHVENPAGFLTKDIFLVVRGKRTNLHVIKQGETCISSYSVRIVS